MQRVSRSAVFVFSHNCRHAALAGEGRKAALATIPSWSEVDGRDAIRKRFEFSNFRQAFAFMTKVAHQAELMDHHPEWFNVYNGVDVVLATHTENGVSPLDITLAGFMDVAASEAQRLPTDTALPSV
eukprot:TRINITY_DN15614_c0_g1_i1.p1 TRINITY_DN15614_c0_g1~~TRINITY_DN15614_c0_g1_i1.p1  ORF type:complete len:145 (-),score=34.12 TRINITY_DN15614_c0_g1_i1:36-416(-)